MNLSAWLGAVVNRVGSRVAKFAKFAKFDVGIVASRLRAPALAPQFVDTVIEVNSHVETGRTVCRI